MVQQVDLVFKDFVLQAQSRGFTAVLFTCNKDWNATPVYMSLFVSLHSGKHQCPRESTDMREKKMKEKDFPFLSVLAESNNLIKYVSQNEKLSVSVPVI